MANLRAHGLGVKSALAFANSLARAPQVDDGPMWVLRYPGGE
jgi:hypothetical protein